MGELATWTSATTKGAKNDTPPHARSNQVGTDVRISRLLDVADADRWIDETRSLGHAAKDVIDVAVVAVGPDEKVDRQHATRRSERELGVSDARGFYVHGRRRVD